MTETFEVRDHRNKAMFRVDDEYLNGYSKLCGVNATMVYLCLCRHADRHQESFPSVKLMAEKTGVSRDSVIRGIKKLIEWNIISKERERKENAQWLNNRYVLLDKSVWKPKPSSIQPLGKAKSQIEDSQVANEAKNQVAHSDTKVAHIKDTHIEGSKATALQGGDWNKLIDAFKQTNPFYQEFYKNTTERKALEMLVKALGFSKCLNLIVALPEINSREFYPKSTKPTELKRNLGKLVAKFNEKKYTPPAIYKNYNK